MLPAQKNILHRKAGEVSEQSEGGGGARRLPRSKKTLRTVETIVAPSDLFDATSPAKAVEEIDCA